MNLISKSLLLTLWIALTSNAFALSDQEAADRGITQSIVPTKSGMHVLMNIGLTYGGDKIGTVNFYNSNGSISHSKDIKAGALYQMGIGGIYQFEDKPLALMLSVNYHTDIASGSNGSISFSRIPVEAIAYYTGKEQFRFGGGVRMVNAPEFSSDVSSPASPVKKMTFKNATGLVGEIGYQLSSQGWLNFRFVSEKYDADTLTLWNGASGSIAGSAPLAASHMGVNFTYVY